MLWIMDLLGGGSLRGCIYLLLFIWLVIFSDGAGSLCAVKSPRLVFIIWLLYFCMFSLGIFCVIIDTGFIILLFCESSLLFFVLILFLHIQHPIKQTNDTKIIIAKIITVILLLTLFCVNAFVLLDNDKLSIIFGGGGSLGSGGGGLGSGGLGEVGGGEVGEDGNNGLGSGGNVDSGNEIPES